VQAQVLNLMQDLQDRLGVTYLFISHDLAVVDLVCDEVIVLYQGLAVEQGSPDQLFTAAAHPYTRALMAAVPRLQPGRRRAPVIPVVAVDAPQGCSFAPRCPYRRPVCLDTPPPLRPVDAGGAGRDITHRAACHRAEEVLAEAVASEPG
jgi:peptide/nickel transport system ATP-binding protein